MKVKNKSYFFSDAHLGSHVFGDSSAREKRLVSWLDSIKDDAKALYLLGDIFDFWFEYKHAIPKGFTRLLGKLAELSDAGTEIHYLTGNHDLWIVDYLPKEIGLILHKKPLTTEISGKIFYLAHGDGLGDNSFSFKFIRRIFHNKVCQFLFRFIHPDLGIKLAHVWANYSRWKEMKYPKPFLGEDKDFMVLFAKSYIKDHPEIDYIIFGHRHFPMELELTPKSKLIYAGDWLHSFTYVVFDGEELNLVRQCGPGF